MTKMSGNDSKGNVIAERDPLLPQVFQILKTFQKTLFFRVLFQRKNQKRSFQERSLKSRAALILQTKIKKSLQA